MTTPPDDAPRQATDVSRRTWMAAERTWLAWWRTGLGTTALAIAVGRLLPTLSKHAQWPYRALGIGYGVLAVALLVVGAVRQRRIAQALRQEDYAEVSPSLVMWLTAAGVGLSTMTLTVIVLAV